MANQPPANGALQDLAPDSLLAPTLSHADLKLQHKNDLKASKEVIEAKQKNLLRS